MRICKTHWEICRETIRERGMWGLVASSGEEAVDRIKAEVEQGPNSDNFDPLMSMNMHWWQSALANGGIGLMGQNPSGENDGHYCPLCEYEKHMAGFVAKVEVGKIADQMADFAREKGLISRIS